MTCFFKVEKFLIGRMSNYPTLLCNILMIDIAIVCIYYLIRKTLGARAATIYMCLSLFFTPFYVYIPFVYTDTLSMPFVALVMVMLYKFINEKTKLKAILYILLGGALAGIGFNTKASVIVIVVAIIIWLILRKEKVLMGIGIFLLGFAISVGAGQIAINNLVPITEEEYNEYKFPVSHWILLGLNGLGGWDADIVQMTIECGDYAVKQETMINGIEEKLSEYGATGLFWHLTDKNALRMWGAGTYNADLYASRGPVREGIIHLFTLPTGKYYPIYYYYSQGYHVALLIFMLFSAIKRWNKGIIDSVLLSHITLFGVLIFFSIWECNSRYLLNFSTLILFTAVAGMTEKFIKKEECN